MSMHKIPLTAEEEAGLRAHGLQRSIGVPSQLADVFRQGMAYAKRGVPECPPGYKLVAISLDPDWVCLEGMTQRELDAYDYGCSSSLGAVNRILDGKDSGHGVANEPWESVRRKILALMANQKPII